MCDHGSGVYFDELGSPWPLHGCYTDDNDDDAPGQPTVDARPSGLQAWSSLRGVTSSAEDPLRSGLLPGLRRGLERVDAGIINRVREAVDTPRETMRIDPYGARAEDIVGSLQDLHSIDVNQRYGLQTNTLGHRHLVNEFVDSDLMQLTVLVDELARDPAAIDLLSFTFLASRRNLSQRLQQGIIVRAHIVPTEIMGIGRLWRANAVEQLA